MKIEIKILILLGLINWTSLEAQELIPVTNLKAGDAYEHTRNINHLTARQYQRLKKGACILYYYSHVKKAYSRGTGFLVNTVDNTYEDEGQKIYLVTANHLNLPLGEDVPADKKSEIYISFDYESANPYFKRETDFEADEYARIKRLWRLQVKPLVRDSGPDLALYEIVSDDPHHPWTIKDSPVYKYAFALGWNLHPKITRNKDIVQIGHPEGDLKKFLSEPASYEFLHYGGFDNNFIELEVKPSHGFLEEPGSSGSPVFDKTGRVFSVATRGTKEGPLLQYATLLENLWYRENWIDFMKYLDPQNTWISTIPGGYLEGMVPQNTDLILQVGSEAKVSPVMNFRAVDFFGFQRVGRKREKDLGDGIILSHTNNDEVYLTFYPALESDRLLYGCFLGDDDPTNTVFAGRSWQTNEGHFPIPPSPKSTTVFNNSSRLFKNWISKLLKENNSIGPTLREFQFEGQFKIQSVGTSKVTAIKLPYQMPYNAVELFEPERVENLWKHYDYHPSKGKKSKNLYINKITYQQGDGDPRHITTDNNGGYLNLININYKIGPITSSYGAVKNNLKMMIDLHNPNNETVAYAVWIDYFNGDVFGGKQEIDHTYNFVYDPALHEVELFASGTLTGSSILLDKEMPTFDQIAMAPGDTRLTRMRVAVKKGTVPPTQGEIFDAGEVEDYLIELVAPTCQDLKPSDYEAYAAEVLPYCGAGGYRESKESLADQFQEETPGSLTFETGKVSDIIYANAWGPHYSFYAKERTTVNYLWNTTGESEVERYDYTYSEIITPRINESIEIGTNADLMHYGPLEMDVYYPKVQSNVLSPDDLTVELPVIVWTLGGGFVKHARPGVTEAICKWLASKGYVVAAVDYRLGMNLSEGELSKRASIRAWQDIRAAVQYWRHSDDDQSTANATYHEGEAMWKVDPSKVYGLGWSSGGITVLNNMYLTDARFNEEVAGDNFLKAAGEWGFTVTEKTSNEIIPAIVNFYNTLSGNVNPLPAVPIPDSWAGLGTTVATALALANFKGATKTGLQALLTLNNIRTLYQAKTGITDYRTYNMVDYPTVPSIGPNKDTSPKDPAEGRSRRDAINMLGYDTRFDKGVSFAGALAKTTWMSEEQSRPIAAIHHEDDQVISAETAVPFDDLYNIQTFKMIYNTAYENVSSTPLPELSGSKDMSLSVHAGSNYHYLGLTGADKGGVEASKHLPMINFNSPEESDELEQKLMYYVDAFLTKTGSTSTAARAEQGGEEPAALAIEDPELVTAPLFNVFPNPATDELNILTEVHRSGPLQVHIYDLNGRKVFDLSRDQISEGHQLITLRKLGLASGTYVLTVKAGDVVRKENILIKRE